MKRFLSFHGRINRKQYILFRLFTIIPIIFIIHFQSLAANRLYHHQNPFIFEFTSLVIACALIPFNLSFVIRRYHDFNKSGYFCIINLILGPIYALAIILEIILCAIPGTKGDNKYGKPFLQTENSSHSIYDSLKAKFTISCHERKDTDQLYKENCFNEYQLIKRKFNTYDFSLIDKLFYSIFDLPNICQSIKNMIEKEHASYYLCVFRLINEITFNRLTTGYDVGLSLDWKGHQQLTEDGQKIYALYILSIREFEKSGVWTSEYAASEIKWMQQELNYLRGATNIRPQMEEPRT